MPKDSSRPLTFFPATSSDFALPSSSSSSPNASSLSTLDDTNILLQRFRRPSLLQKAGYHLSETRLHSPLASSFTLHSRRRSQSIAIAEESESDRDRMMTDSPSSSETNTPPLKVPCNSEEELSKPTIPKPPSTPPRRRSSNSIDGFDMPSFHNRRLSIPLKSQRILHLLTESKPEEAEVKSEAAFQRLIASSSELPAQPLTPRSFVDRGRYPEEAGHEEVTREDSPSDDEPDVDETQFAYTPLPNATQPIAIRPPKGRTRTPGGSIAGSINGDDAFMSVSETSSSFGGGAMDVDMPLGSPLLTSMTPSAIGNWRYTPPPTASAVRSNKRKLEDRFDPYPSTSKRRAVSPSLHHLRDSHQLGGSPIARSGSGPRLPIAIPVTIPTSTASSAASSPTISSSYPSYPRGIGLTSSPTLRSSLIMASPILRPINRRREEEGELREIEGARRTINGLTLNSESASYDVSESAASLSRIPLLE